MPTLKEALASGDIYVALQPIVDLRKKDIFAYEALCRSKRIYEGGAEAVIEAAIEEELLGELGRALREMASAACPLSRLFVNVHPSEFDEGWLVRPDDPIFTHEEPVFLEITESVPLSHFHMCHSVLREVRSKGVCLAVDDLGAGYSNLKYISDLAPEVVKLDLSLTQELDRQPRLCKLVGGLVRMCVDLGAKVVAEGIETVDELKAVLDCGVHYGQGYLLARPGYPAPPLTWPL